MPTILPAVSTIHSKSMHISHLSVDFGASNGRNQEGGGNQPSICEHDICDDSSNFRFFFPVPIGDPPAPRTGPTRPPEGRRGRRPPTALTHHRRPPFPAGGERWRKEKRTPRAGREREREREREIHAPGGPASPPGPRPLPLPPPQPPPMGRRKRKRKRPQPLPVVLVLSPCLPRRDFPCRGRWRGRGGAGPLQDPGRQKGRHRRRDLGRLPEAGAAAPSPQAPGGWGRCSGRLWG